VLANDSDPDAGDSLNPASVTVVSPPATGTAGVNPDGSITFTSTAAGTVTFQYTVQDNHGAVSSPATVTVTVTGADSITIILAQFRRQKRDWRIRGTNTIPGPGNTITIHNGPTLTSPILGTIAVDALGAWDFVLKGSSIAPDPTNTVSVESTKGGQRLAVPLQITN
jgi:Bacterial Ig domain